MKPIPFPEQNKVYGAGQPEYLPLPAYCDPNGQVVTCWQMTWRERVRAFFTGKVWFTTLTFNRPIQPQLPSIDKPFHYRDC